MAHRLLVQFPTLYHLGTFDFDALKKQLTEWTAEDISAVKVRELMNRIDQAYTALSDDELILTKQRDGKIAHTRDARYLSFPIGFCTAEGDPIRMHLHRSADAAHQGQPFMFLAFSTSLLADAEQPPERQRQIESGVRQSIDHPKHQKKPSQFIQRIENVKSAVHEQHTQAQLMLHELNALSEAFASEPDSKPATLVQRFRQRIREFFRK